MGVIPGVSWIVGDGRNIRFWRDTWLSNEPLIDSCTQALPAGEEDLPVMDVWRHEVGWDLPRITPFITEDKRLELGEIVVDTVTGAKDILSWGGTRDGVFTVKSAYALITRNNYPTVCVKGLFDRIWRVVAPERVKCFLWLVANQTIMTNMERARRHLSVTGVCEVCKSGYETILHVLRDCQAMRGIWSRIVPARKQGEFFSQPLLDWIFLNLEKEESGAGTQWATQFAMGVWWSWKWRCGNIFGSSGKCRDKVSFIQELAVEVTMANRRVRESSRAAPIVSRTSRWSPPSIGWFKLNTDGASRGNPGLATAGGVLRDSDGEWCGGFSVNIGRCSTILAELWGVYYGLYMAWEKRVGCLELEVDSEIVVGFLKTGISESHPLSFLARLCYGFLSKDWIVRVSHIYREANRLTDSLANHAFELPLGFHVLNNCPNVYRAVLFKDIEESVTRTFDPM